MNPKINLAAILLICGVFVMSLAHGQLSTYSYQRELTGITKSWHHLTLPIDVLAKAKKELTDVRIYGIKENGDTIEAPYVLRVMEDKLVSKEVSFNIINTTSNSSGHYYTFEILGEESLNTIDLEFDLQNFDWHVRLEGSQNQLEWFTLLDDYRMVSIKNAITSFSFTTLTFPSAKYRYYRLSIPGKVAPLLSNVIIRQIERQAGDYQPVQFVSKRIRQEGSSKQTIIDLDLAERVHLSQLKINVSDSIDFYRPVRVSYLSDSFKTEKGWNYQYQPITTGTLNSFQTNEFLMENTAAKQLRIVVENQDNQPLNIRQISAKRNIYELAVRFNEEATYYLAYGNELARQPRYDIARFEDSIPSELTYLKLGNEKSIAEIPEAGSGSIFENKVWLWGLISVIILILGWFSLQMIKKTESNSEE